MLIHKTANIPASFTDLSPQRLEKIEVVSYSIATEKMMQLTWQIGNIFKLIAFDVTAEFENNRDFMYYYNFYTGTVKIGDTICFVSPLPVILLSEKLEYPSAFPGNKIILDLFNEKKVVTLKRLEVTPVGYFAPC